MFHKRRGTCWLATRISVSQDGLATRSQLYKVSDYGWDHIRGLQNTTLLCRPLDHQLFTSAKVSCHLLLSNKCKTETRAIISPCVLIKETGFSSQQGFWNMCHFSSPMTSLHYSVSTISHLPFNNGRRKTETCIPSFRSLTDLVRTKYIV